jgi:hypothetical protein
MKYVPQQTMKEMRLVLAPPAYKLGLSVPSKIKAQDYMIAMKMNLKFVSTQKFKDLFYLYCVG